MKMTIWKNYLAYLCLTLLLIGGACKKKDSVGTPAMISGNESKTWKAVKETTASGEESKITGAEKKQVMQFFANGSFSMQSASQNASGKWVYDTMARTLTLHFVGSDVSETFQVLSLSDDEMKLQAADNSQMILEAD